MALPTTKQELADWILRRLGAPVVNVEVTDVQLEDAIDEALQWFQEWHYDGTLRAYRTIKIEGDVLTGNNRKHQGLNAPQYDATLAEEYRMGDRVMTYTSENRPDKIWVKYDSEERVNWISYTRNDVDGIYFRWDSELPHDLRFIFDSEATNHLDSEGGYVEFDSERHVFTIYTALSDSDLAVQIALDSEKLTWVDSEGEYVVFDSDVHTTKLFTADSDNGSYVDSDGGYVLYDSEVHFTFVYDSDSDGSYVDSEGEYVVFDSEVHSLRTYYLDSDGSFIDSDSDFRPYDSDKHTASVFDSDLDGLWVDSDSIHVLYDSEKHVTIFYDSDDNGVYVDTVDGFVLYDSDIHLDSEYNLLAIPFDSTDSDFLEYYVPVVASEHGYLKAKEVFNDVFDAPVLELTGEDDRPAAVESNTNLGTNRFWIRLGGVEYALDTGSAVDNVFTLVGSDASEGTTTTYNNGASAAVFPELNKGKVEILVSDSETKISITNLDSENQGGNAPFAAGTLFYASFVPTLDPIIPVDTNNTWTGGTGVHVRYSVDDNTAQIFDDLFRAIDISGGARFNISNAADRVANPIWRYAIFENNAATTIYSQADALFVSDELITFPNHVFINSTTNDVLGIRVEQAGGNTFVGINGNQWEFWNVRPHTVDVVADLSPRYFIEIDPTGVYNLALKDPAQTFFTRAEPAAQLFSQRSEQPSRYTLVRGPYTGNRFSYVPTHPQRYVRNTEYPQKFRRYTSTVRYSRENVIQGTRYDQDYTRNLARRDDYTWEDLWKEENLVLTEPVVNYDYSKEGQVGIPIPEDVIAVTKVHRIDNFSGMGMWNYEYQFFLNNFDYFYGGGGASSMPMTNYYTAKMNIEFINQMMNIQPAIRFSKTRNRLYIDTNWARMERAATKDDYYLLCEVYEVNDPEVYGDVYKDKWLKRYALALTKKDWGSNLKKYSNTSLPGGLQVDGQALYDEAVAEVTALEEELKKSQLEMDFIIG